jgi:tetratricopeptide (TPR) repeat protein
MRDTRPSSHLGLYRAGITGPEHRRSITVARDSLLVDTVEILRKGIGRKPKHHFLFIGPRGIGKTHLLSLIEDEVHREPVLNAGYHVVRFAEESHRVLSFGDFLLGVCEILRDTLPAEAEWGALYQRLATEERDEIIVDTLVPAIRKRRRDTKQSLIIMLENLQQIFDQQMKDARHIAALRGFLMEDNGCLLIATAPLHFGSITDHKEPFYDFFDIQVLDQLTQEQTIELIRKNLAWEQRKELLADFTKLRPRLMALYRMTGGSPRLTLMLYELIAHEAVSEVKRQFQLLLDRITPFYQDRMRDLGPQERAVLETIATMRDQAKTPSAISARMRMKPSQISSLLKRLSTAQYLRSVENIHDKRSRLYTIREGFFDIWLAMNVSRGARERLPFLVEFFAEFYPSIEERNRKREEYRQRLASGEFDPPQAAVARSDLRAGLDYLSEVGKEEERAREKLRLASMHQKEGNAAEAKSYLREAQAIQLDSMGTWIVRRAGSEIQSDYLTEIEELIACWDSLRSGDLESFADKVKQLGQGLDFRSWSEAKIAFLKDHLTLLPQAKDRVETRLQIGNFLTTLARWSEAEAELRAALAEASEIPDTDLQSWALNELAKLLYATGRLAEAEPLMRRALAIDEQSYGAEHPEVATDLSNLAQVLHATNRLAEAEPMMRRALAIDEQSYGVEHPSVARDLNNLALLLRATNRLAEAEPLMRRALAIVERSNGTEHPTFAICLNSLAALLQATNRLAEAEPLMRRALAIDEQSYGAEHPNIARDLSNLAMLLLATSRLAEAEPLMRRALAIDEQSYGAEHPNVARNLNNLALMLHATNRLAEAEPLSSRVVAIFVAFEKATGHKHPHMQIVLANYRRILSAMGLSADEAEARIQAKLQGEL